ncbi:MAG: BatD family protein [Proteobacteria bacterium]|nr:BatD family protein [Pseudomonadota bacterium]
MSRFSLKVFLLMGCLISGIAGAQEGSVQEGNVQEDGVQANVAISIQQAEDIWMGQQLTLNIDLKTTGFSFSDTTFNLPEVSGAFLMQIDTTTVKMTENIDGQNWQVIRYPLALYPQRAGLLEIPPITVRFSSARGFGSEQKAFEFQTSPLQLNIKAPPGIKEGDMVITTTAFKLEYEWQPDSQAETTTAQTGDAFTLTVKRSAGDISAILLPPLPVFRAEGLAAYPQVAEVIDKTNRGSLTGERSDKIIWVAEKPGTYSIPAIRFQWWDPRSHELKQQLVQGLKLEVTASPTGEDSAAASNKGDYLGVYLRYLMSALVLAVVVYFLWRRFAINTAAEAVETEKLAFTALQQACNTNQPAQAYSKLNAWLAWSPAGIITLADFSSSQEDQHLSTQLNVLQEALISPESQWQGAELLNILTRVRISMHRQKDAHSKVQLVPLNP